MTTYALAPPYVTVAQLADMWGTKVETIREYARRSSDPLPIRYIKGKTRYGFVALSELEAWVERNTSLFGDRGEKSA